MKTVICFLIVTISIPCVVSGQDPAPSLDAKEVEEIKQIMDLREWSDSTGSFSTMARFKGVDFVGLTATLKLKNVETKNIPLDKLGENELKTIARFYELNQIVVQKLKDEIEIMNSQASSDKEQADADKVGRVAELRAEIKKLSNWVPADQQNNNNNNAGIPLLTIKKLDAIGLDYVGKTVRFERLGFIDVDSGVVRIYFEEQADKLIGFKVCDVNDDLSVGNTHNYIAAEKEEWADLLLSIKRGSRINLTAEIVRDDNKLWLFVEDIQIAEKK